MLKIDRSEIQKSIDDLFLVKDSLARTNEEMVDDLNKIEKEIDRLNRAIDYLVELRNKEESTNLMNETDEDLVDDGEFDETGF